MRKLILLLLLVAGGMYNITWAQLTKKEQKIVKKADKYYNSKEYDKAITTLDTVVKMHENDYILWDKMISYYFSKYESYKSSNVVYVSVKKGSSPKQFAKQLQKAFDINNIMARHNSYIAFLQKCKEAQRVCEEVNMAGVYLRNFLYDHVVDTGVSQEALKHFRAAESQFFSRNYFDAAKEYQKAIEIQSDFFKARLYLGDCYYMMGDYKNAAKYFREACEKFPDLLEPRKFLVDAVWGGGNKTEARKLCVDAIMVYPDAVMFSKLRQLCEETGVDFNRHWIKRPCYVNNPDTTVIAQKKETFAGTPWYFYIEAKEKIRTYCDTNGIINVSNPFTKQRYLEAYCWEYMIQQSNDSSLDYAREMLKKDMLDCYVLYSMFHIDLVRQFQDIRKTNPGKVKSFLEGLMK